MVDCSTRHTHGRRDNRVAAFVPSCATATSTCHSRDKLLYIKWLRLRPANLFAASRGFSVSPRIEWHTNCASSGGTGPASRLAPDDHPAGEKAHASGEEDLLRGGAPGGEPSVFHHARRGAGLRRRGGSGGR